MCAVETYRKLFMIIIKRQKRSLINIEYSCAVKPPFRNARRPLANASPTADRQRIYLALDD